MWLKSTVHGTCKLNSTMKVSYEKVLANGNCEVVTLRGKEAGGKATR